MQVANVMTRDVKSCVPSDTLDRPAHLMLAHDTGCVPVVDEVGRAIGLITDRDLCMASFVSGRPLHELSVERTITGRLHACSEDADIAMAHHLMREHAVRRLPVVDADGKLVGLVSLADLVQSTPFVAAKTARNKALELVLGTLQGITTPRDVDVAERYAAVSTQPKRKRASSARPKAASTGKTARKTTRKTTGKTVKKTAAKTTRPKTARKTAKKSVAKTVAGKRVTRKAAPKTTRGGRSRKAAGG